MVIFVGNGINFLDEPGRLDYPITVRVRDNVAWQKFERGARRETRRAADPDV